MLQLKQRSSKVLILGNTPHHRFKSDYLGNLNILKHLGFSFGFKTLIIVLVLHFTFSALGNTNIHRKVEVGHSVVPSANSKFPFLMTQMYYVLERQIWVVYVILCQQWNQTAVLQLQGLCWSHIFAGAGLDIVAWGTLLKACAPVFFPPYKHAFKNLP